MKRPTHLLWEHFIVSVLIRGEQRVHRVNSVPVIDIYGDGVNNRIGIWVETPPDTSVPESALRLAFVSAQIIHREEKTFLEISSDARHIFRQFYIFAIAVADRVVQDRLSAIEAVEIELQCFAEFLQEKSLLSLERQLGLLGELFLLGRLLDAGVPDAVDAWIGPLGEPHDFRVGRNEFEVKTSLGTRRIHTINGLNQLIPSPDCSLFLLSILLGPAGSSGGFSVASTISLLSTRLTRAPSQAKKFELALNSSGYRETDAAHYMRLFDLRRPPAIVYVNNQLPLITSKTILNLFGPDASRVEALNYDLNIEGLEKEEGTSEYASAFRYRSLMK